MKIINGRIVTFGAAGSIDRGFVEFSGGKITSLGRMDECVQRPGEESFDAEGGMVVPGLIDCHCHVGIGVENAGGVDFSETVDPISPQQRGADAFYPFDRAVGKAVRCGITTVVTGPGSTALIGGQLMAIKLNGKFPDEAAIKTCCAMKFAVGNAPISTFSKLGKAPSTRMAEMSMLRKALKRASDYMYRMEDDPSCRRDEKLDALLPLIKGEIPAHVHCNRADDIVAVLMLMRGFGIKCVIVHAAQAADVLDEIKGLGGSLILGPMYSTSRDLESHGIGFALPAAAEAKGIPMAICTDACPHLSSVQLLAPSAALAVRRGLSETAALRSITLGAAEMAGISDTVGKLEVGLDADIAVFDTSPFDFRHYARAVFINGKRMI